MAADLVPENYDGSLNVKKRESSLALWKIVNSFYEKILWRGQPSFVRDMRGLFGIGSGEIDLYKTIFPFPGEVVVDAYRIESEKRKLVVSLESVIRALMEEQERVELELEETEASAVDLRGELARITASLSDDELLEEERESLMEEQERVELELEETEVRIADLGGELATAKDRVSESRNKMRDEKKAFVDRYSKYGYSSKFEEIGIGKLTKEPDGEGGYGLSITQYNVSFKAIDAMREFFHNPLEKMDFNQCVEKWTYWMQTIVGKAKLVPGRHYLLFPFFTMLAATKIVSVYDGRNDVFKVNKLLDRMMLEMEQAGGIPGYVKKEVLRYMTEDKRHFGVFYDMIKTRQYIGELFRYITRSSKDITDRIRSMFPLDFFKTENDESALTARSPWAWAAKASKDTSSK